MWLRVQISRTPATSIQRCRAEGRHWSKAWLNVPEALRLSFVGTRMLLPHGKSTRLRPALRCVVSSHAFGVACRRVGAECIDDPALSRSRGYKSLSGTLISAHSIQHNNSNSSFQEQSSQASHQFQTSSNNNAHPQPSISTNKPQPQPSTTKCLPTPSTQLAQRHLA